MADLLAELARLRTRRGRESSGRIALEGLRVVERALRAGAHVLHIGTRGPSLDSDWARQVLRQAQARDVTITAIDDTRFDAYVAGRDLGGVVALAATPNATELPSTWRRVLVAVDIHDPGNVGALVRTTLASGADAFVAVGETDPWHPRAVRTAMGSTFRIPVSRAEDPASLSHLLSSGATLAAMTDGAIDLPRVAAPDRLAVLVGSEAHGIPATYAEGVDLRVRIPMAAGVDSYSVNAAAAILLYALRTEASTAP